MLRRFFTEFVDNFNIWALLEQKQFRKVPILALFVTICLQAGVSQKSKQKQWNWRICIKITISPGKKSVSKYGSSSVASSLVEWAWSRAWRALLVVGLSANGSVLSKSPFSCSRSAVTSTSSIAWFFDRLEWKYRLCVPTSIIEAQQKRQNKKFNVACGSAIARALEEHAPLKKVSFQFPMSFNHYLQYRTNLTWNMVCNFYSEKILDL